MDSVVVIGAGQAGARFCSQMRSLGFSGRLTLIGDEPHLPYERPALSKAALVSEGVTDYPGMHSLDHYEKNDIDLIRGKAVSAIDLQSRSVRLADNTALAFGWLVIATGSRAKTVTVEGIAPAAINTLRSIENARNLNALLQPGKTATMIGGGFIGLEVAASARARQCSVHVIEPRSRLIERVVSPFASNYLESLHTQHGTNIHLGRSIKTARHVGERIELTLSNGFVFETDVLLSGIGSEPNIELALMAGLQCANGIVVNSECRTSDPGIYAIGDVACSMESPEVNQPSRLESWENAEVQAVRAACSMYGAMGHAAPALQPPQAPWFWTDQYDLNLQIIGFPSAGDQMVLRQKPGQEQKAIAFHLRDGVVCSAELFNAGKDRKTVRQLITQGKPLDVAALAKPDIELRTLLTC
jgi:3-phenylpropionate/trans-cinnamate dioxygenase ferredoxin reductase subunit